MLKRIILVCMVSLLAVATANEPTVMLKQVSSDLIKQLNSNKDEIDNNHSLVANIIKKVLLPNVDKTYMSKSVVGPYYWRSANVDDRKEFIQEFETMVTNNYARLFSSYSDQKVTFIPFRGDLSKQTKIEVKSLVTANSKSDFKVYYKLIKGSEGNWMIYDFSIDGISMVESYKSQFAPVLSDSGMVGLISDMKRHNHKE
ncbi:MAG: ABC transporter substrate-binding protein [Legionellales bacterium]|jgi:phospholipid transport system substrate-binding protein|nr:ABC transporter substrate-binding protein [Legionellales bacterium]